MELKTEHRKALISELEKAKKTLFVHQKGKQFNTSENLKDLYDISIFLEQERITLIEQSIINNKIEY